MARRSLAGKRAIVTGASSGIGREIALQLASQHVDLLVTARREDRLSELVSELKSRGVRAEHVVGEITDAGLRDRLLSKVRDSYGGLDILINNAGVGAIGRFDAADPARLRRIFDINFFAPVELIRHALPMLREGNHPIIVNISSVLGHRAVPKKSEYCASKFALHGFSDALRAELVADGIDVLLVSPSTTRSEFFDNVLEDNDRLPWLKLGGMRADIVAKKTVRAIAQGRQEIILTLGGKLLVWCDRICPPLVNRLVAKFG
jgi:short-subunit dehydrogenase